MFRKGYYHCIVLCAIIAIVAGLSYANFVANKLYEESRSHLTEIYTEVNQAFTTLATTNWNMLMDWNEYLAYGLDTLPQDRLDEYFEADKSRWGYTEVYFLKDTGEYMTLDGKHGQFPCQPQLETLQSEQQNIVLDVAEPDGNVLTLFAIPAAKNTYRGFSYSAVAAGYNNAAINEALNVTAFSGEAQCYMMDPNGRVILSTDKEKPPFANFLTYLKHHSELSASEVEQMSANFEAKQSGIMQFHASGTAYYLLYQPVGFQDWMMVGAVPKSAVNTNIPQIQIVTIIALSAIFLASAIIAGCKKRRAAVSGGALYHSGAELPGHFHALFHGDQSAGVRQPQCGKTSGHFNGIHRQRSEKVQRLRRQRRGQPSQPEPEPDSGQRSNPLQFRMG